MVFPSKRAFAALLLLALTSLIAGCNWTPAQDTTAANITGAVATDICQLSAAIEKIESPTSTANNILAIACPDITPTVNLVASAVGADGTHAQCTDWKPLDDSKRYGGNGKARAGQVVCSSLKAAVETELAKAPSARRGAKGPVGS